MWNMPHDAQTDAIQNLMKQFYEHQWMSLTKSYQILMSVLQEMIKLQEKMMAATRTSIPQAHSSSIHPNSSHPCVTPQEVLAKSFSVYATLMEQWKNLLPQALAMKNPWQNGGPAHPSSDVSA